MNIDGLCDDLVAERRETLGLLADLDDQAWETPTPADGWTIRDQITHLAWFDEAATQAIVDPDAFRARRREAAVDGLVEGVRASLGQTTGPDARDWLQRAGDALTDAARHADPTVRVPWYGPNMSVASTITARNMETWAHTQDIADARRVVRTPSARLEHVAFIGCRAFANSFIAQARPVPDVAVRVELDEWSFGPADAADAVRGSLVDFCLLVTQRRHVDDTDLVATGAVASEWLTIAQAFAGPPGRGRTAGQFGARS
jgi:uncharacterized protein (TIGR03084 family)